MLLAGFLFCFANSCIFVLAIYAVGRSLDRNCPKVICRRIFAVSCACFLSALLAYLHLDLPPGEELLSALGVKWDRDGLVGSLGYSTVLTLILFLGPIAGDGFPIVWVGDAPCWQVCLRDYIMAPLTEEFVFRGVMIATLRSSLSDSQLILVVPLFFGVAHVHHLLEMVLHERRPLGEAFLITFAQTAYTSLFGAYACFLFLKTGHLGASVSAHSVCNIFGLPDFTPVFDLRSKGPIVSACYYVGFVLFILGLISL